jgi:branched-subunit amino acid transport protein
MTAIPQELWPYVVLVFAGFLPNEVWRMLGLFLSRGIDEGSELLTWVRAVATAVLAGVVGKLIVFPSGALAGVPLTVRVVAAAIGLAMFFAMRRSVLAGVVTGVAALMAGAWWSGV